MGPSIAKNFSKGCSFDVPLASVQALLACILWYIVATFTLSEHTPKEGIKLPCPEDV